MFGLREYRVAQRLDQADECLHTDKGNVILGGMGRKNYHTGIDLSQLGLNGITETADEIEIACMTTLRQIETSPRLEGCFGRILADSVSPIVGVQFRNAATIGGSVFSLFSFSDIITALLAENSDDASIAAACDQVVYTNTMSAGAFRGYGATQGTFALEACIQKGREMIGWEKKFPDVRISDTKVWAVGAAITMQGSSISNIDMAAVEIRLQDDAYYTLMIGATEMGTGCDTILAQIAAECLECELDKIIVNGVDTDHSPYDTGSYAFSTTFLTGMAVVKACERLKTKIIREAAIRLSADPDTLTFDGRAVFNGENSMDLDALARTLVVGAGNCFSATASHSSPVSPLPFMAGFAEIKMDLETGKTHVIDYVGVVDCGDTHQPQPGKDPDRGRHCPGNWHGIV